MVARRIGIVFVFALLGPIVGSLIFVIVGYVQGIARGSMSIDDIPNVGIIFFGYLLGFVPAALAGVLYALAPRAWQKIALAPGYGFVATFAFGWAVTRMINDGSVWMSLLGAGAALVCAMVVRACALDLVGAAETSTSPRHPQA